MGDNKPNPEEFGIPQMDDFYEEAQESENSNPWEPEAEQTEPAEIPPVETIKEVAVIQNTDDEEFLKEAEPIIQKIEAVRLEQCARYERYKKFGFIIGLLLLPLTLYADYLLIINRENSGNDFFGVTIIMMIVVAICTQIPKFKYMSVYEEQAFPLFAEIFNMMFDPTGKVPENKIKQSKLVPSYSRYSTNDYFYGNYKKVGIEFCECTLAKQKRKDVIRDGKKTTANVTVVIFKGIVVLLTLKKPFQGQTYYNPIEEKTLLGRMTSIVVSAIKESIKTTFQSEADELTKPSMIDKMKNMQDRFEGTDFSFAAFDNHLMFFIETKKNFFKIPKMSESAVNINTLMDMKNEVGSIMTIIDEMEVYDPNVLALQMEIEKVFGLDYKMTGRIKYDKLVESRLLPKHERYLVEDYVAGMYKGIEVSFSEIKLQDKARKDVFHGLAVMIDLPKKKFYGHTILKQETKFKFFNKPPEGLKKANLVDLEFERELEVFTNDQMEARYLIDPVMIEDLKKLNREYKGSSLVAAWYGSKMLILIKREDDQFEFNEDATTQNLSGLAKIKDEIDEVLKIVDKLNLYDPMAVHGTPDDPIE